MGSIDLGLGLHFVLRVADAQFEPAWWSLGHRSGGHGVLGLWAYGVTKMCGGVGGGGGGGGVGGGCVGL